VNNKKSTKKLGRPKLPKGAAKGRIVPVRLSDEELKLFTKAANASEHKTLSGWIRHSLREVATR
jgi:uncharacterized protein (DUF1778 family)